jgi:hypothetical protein
MVSCPGPWTLLIQYGPKFELNVVSLLFYPGRNQTGSSSSACKLGFPAGYQPGTMVQTRKRGVFFVRSWIVPTSPEPARNHPGKVSPARKRCKMVGLSEPLRTTTCAGPKSQAMPQARPKWEYSRFGIFGNLDPVARL